MHYGNRSCNSIYHSTSFNHHTHVFLPHILIHPSPFIPLFSFNTQYPLHSPPFSSSQTHCPRSIRSPWRRCLRCFSWLFSPFPCFTPLFWLCMAMAVTTTTKRTMVRGVWRASNARHNAQGGAARHSTTNLAWSYVRSAAKSAYAFPQGIMVIKSSAHATTTGRPRKEDQNALELFPYLPFLPILSWPIWLL